MGRRQDSTPWTATTAREAAAHSESAIEQYQPPELLQAVRPVQRKPELGKPVLSADAPVYPETAAVLAWEQQCAPSATECQCHVVQAALQPQEPHGQREGRALHAAGLARDGLGRLHAQSVGPDPRSQEPAVGLRATLHVAWAHRSHHIHDGH